MAAGLTNRGVLVLESGVEFPGVLFGAEVSAKSIATSKQGKDFGYGEVVFNTSMTGYQEVLTDPSYYGQMVCMTTPHIGNTGVNKEDPESARVWCAGFILNQSCDDPIHWRSKGNLGEYLKENGIPGLMGVDTRALTRHIRSQGVVRGVILPEAEKGMARGLLADLPRFEGRDLIHEVSTKEPYYWSKGQQVQTPVQGQDRYRVVAMDFGIKWNMLHSLEHLGCEVLVVPAKTPAKDILAKNPDGIFLSNGPGDPSAAPYAVETVRDLLGKVPIFGVCMGHQILCLALGAKTYKLKFGHRGSNQPVLETTSKKVEISSHNHGYAVDGNTLPRNAEITYVNLNDKTVEGIEIKEANAFSVQYHPEACPGPHDSALIFDKFIQGMRENVPKIPRAAR